jgi:hypothetical protein
METLQRFVRGVVTRRALSKPDRISPTLELRRMAVPSTSDAWEPGQPVSTDFYELYWAHLMTGTSWNHVTAWIRTLMLRPPATVPSRLWTLWVASWIAASIGVVVAVAGVGRPDVSSWWLAALAAAAMTLAKSTGFYFGLQYVGDAARYLSPTPPNVGVRQAIRSAAIDLLNGLHDDPTWRRYHRVVVVGHSLGSVIGYDALTHLWQQRHHPTSGQRWAQQPNHARLTELLNSGAVLTADEARALQAGVWREQRSIGVQWKITDFVTLGSPLTHAPFLMAKDRADFEKRRRAREFPSCPPTREDGRDTDYGQSLLELTPPDAGGVCKLLHHAAPFACTRWTNLFFPRDLVGGTLEHFGGWIKEPTINSPHRFPHTRYWRVDEPAHEELTKALDLDGWWTSENAEAAFAAQEAESKALKQGTHD